MQAFKQSMKLMGNHFEITVIGDNVDWANEMIAIGVNEIKRIERLLTTYQPNSETNLINDQAGIEPVIVSREIIDLINRANRISSVTLGAFDLSYGSVDNNLWNFNTAMHSLPSKEIALQRARLINYKNIVIDQEKHTVFLKEKGMKIGFGGIGKGYAADCAKQQMQKAGVQNGVVNASGDLTTWGEQANGNPWTIGVVHPDFKEQVFSYMDISNLSVATSGNYEKYIMVNGNKYSHTINPRTGYPITGIKSVTIITTNAEIADAMATPIMIMGVYAGLDMINQMNAIEAIIIDDNNQLFTSKNIKISA